METLTEDVLTDLEDKAKAATPGPWKVGTWWGRCPLEHKHDSVTCHPNWSLAEEYRVPGTGIASGAPGVDVVGSDYDGAVIGEADARHIAAANPATVLALIAEVREHRRRRAQEAPEGAKAAHKAIVEALAWHVSQDGDRYVPAREGTDTLLALATDAGRLKAALEASEEARALADGLLREAQEAGRAEWQQAMGVAGQVAEAERQLWDVAHRKHLESNDAESADRCASRLLVAQDIASGIRNLASPPTTPAGRLTLVGHHLRAAKALCGDVAKDAACGSVESESAKLIMVGVEMGIRKARIAVAPRDDTREG